MNKLSIKDLPLSGKRVFMRVDFNVPLDDATLRVTDDTRIRETLPTVEYALRQGAKLILASHLGRPKGKVDPKLSLRPAAERLRMLLNEKLRDDCNVGFAPDCVGQQAEEMASKLEAGQSLLLENLRFHSEEEANDPGFAKKLSKLCELYVNDAFGSAHRAHASTHGITKFVEKAAAGLLMERELTYLGKVLQDPGRPFVAIIGGAKVSDKIDVIRNLLTRVDALLIGGAMAYTFLKAQGKQVGRSLVEEDKVELAKDLLERAAKRGVQLLLPSDHVVAEKIDAHARTQVVSSDAIPTDLMGLDIGPRTIAEFAKEIEAASTVVWNGPMGVFEVAPFANGTMKIARAVADSGATSIIGGGDSVAAVQAAGVADQITHISTGGGASLEFLEGKKLPGVEALTNK
jgi:phosphoglycerate kinase